MDDNRIIELFIERSDKAITELSKKYGTLCKSVAMNILGNERDAEECVNDAYLAVWNTIPPQKPEQLTSYICRIVRNLALKKYHSNTALKRNSIYDVALDEFAECLPSPHSVENETEANSTAALINTFLETLNEQDRILFVKRYWFSESITDLAKAFNRSEHYISVRLFQIRKALKKYLEKEGVNI